MDRPSAPKSIWSETAEIAADLRMGKRSALTQLFDVTAPRLLRYAEALTKNRADAEDVLQSALMRVARKPKQFGQAQKPWAYLVRIVRNESFKLVSKRRSQPKLIQLLASWSAPGCSLEVAESREQVQDAVRKLPPEQAEVVVLKIWEGFTFAEIAELIGESPNTAASRYRYALEKLARWLQPLAIELQESVQRGDQFALQSVASFGIPVPLEVDHV